MQGHSSYCFSCVLVFRPPRSILTPLRPVQDRQNSSVTLTRPCLRVCQSVDGLRPRRQRCPSSTARPMPLRGVKTKTSLESSGNANENNFHFPFGTHQPVISFRFARSPARAPAIASLPSSSPPPPPSSASIFYLIEIIADLRFPIDSENKSTLQLNSRVVALAGFRIERAGQVRATSLLHEKNANKTIVIAPSSRPTYVNASRTREEA